jgi:hypothetical protein
MLDTARNERLHALSSRIDESDAQMDPAKLASLMELKTHLEQVGVRESWRAPRRTAAGPSTHAESEALGLAPLVGGGVPCEHCEAEEESGDEFGGATGES